MSNLIEEYSEQNGIPTPENPVPIKNIKLEGVLQMNKECYNCANQDNCIRYNVEYGSKYCEIHKN